MARYLHYYLSTRDFGTCNLNESKSFLRANTSMVIKFQITLAIATKIHLNDCKNNNCLDAKVNTNNFFLKVNKNVPYKSK